MMRLYVARIEGFQYKADLVDAREAELLVGLGLVMIHPTYAEITAAGVWVWEDWCMAMNPRWVRPQYRKRAFDVVNKPRRRKAS